MVTFLIVLCCLGLFVFKMFCLRKAWGHDPDNIIFVFQILYEILRYMEIFAVFLAVSFISLSKLNISLGYGIFVLLVTFVSYVIISLVFTSKFSKHLEKKYRKERTQILLKKRNKDSIEFHFHENGNEKTKEKIPNNVGEILTEHESQYTDGIPVLTVKVEDRKSDKGNSSN